MNYMTECHRPNKTGTNGYAQKVIWDKEAKKYRGTLLHRWVYLQTFGAVPEGFQIDHICHNEAVARGECEGGVTCLHRACINPEHLRAVSRSENQRSGLAGFGNRTHCESRGHELTQDNIYTYNRNGSQVRECWECRKINGRLKTREYRARKKEAA
jgi:hypothetical protein